jgi:hypothetical protein
MENNMRRKCHRVSALFSAHEAELDEFIDAIKATFLIEEGDVESRELFATILVFDRIHAATTATISHMDLEDDGEHLMQAINEALAMYDVDGSYTLSVVLEDRTQGAVGPIAESIEIGALNEGVDDELECDPPPHPQY